MKPADAPELDGIQPPTIPALTDAVPEDDPHVVRAKLLANAGLNEYIAPEIQAAEGSDEWGAFAEAEIYHSYGEDAKAMRVMKRALPVLHLGAHRIDSAGILAHSVSANRTGAPSRRVCERTVSIPLWWRR